MKINPIKTENLKSITQKYEILHTEVFCKNSLIEIFNDKIFLIYNSNYEVIIEKLKLNSIEIKLASFGNFNPERTRFMKKVPTNPLYKNIEKQIIKTKNRIINFSKAIIDNVFYFACTNLFTDNLFTVYYINPKTQEFKIKASIVYKEFQNNYSTFSLCNFMKYNKEIVLVVSNIESENIVFFSISTGEVKKVIKLKNILFYHNVHKNSILAYGDKTVDAYSKSTGKLIKVFSYEGKGKFADGFILNKNTTTTKFYSLKDSGELVIFNWETSEIIKVVKLKKTGDGLFNQLLLWNDNYLLAYMRGNSEINTFNTISDKENSKLFLDFDLKISKLDKPENCERNKISLNLGQLLLVHCCQENISIMNILEFKNN